MRYVITLTNVSRADGEKLGYRASDLGIIRDKGFNVPLSFVVNNEAFEDFMAENGIKPKIARILDVKSADDAYQEIVQLFQKSAISNDLKEELLEAYESLMIEPGISAHSIISEVDLPYVAVIRSPSYLLHTDDDQGILQNVKGKEMLLEALKLVWASLYFPDSMIYRKKSGISESFSLGIIVQKMKPTTVSAFSYSRLDADEYLIGVHSWKGLQDYGDTVLGKDYHEVDVNSLLIKKAEVNHQEALITRDLAKDELVKRPLLDEGKKQKLNDKLVSEIARITKRSKSFIGKDLKLYFSVRDDIVNVLQANRMTFDERLIVEENDDLEVSVDDSGKESYTHEHDITMLKTEKNDEKLVLPGIMEHTEAKEHVLKTMAHKIFSLEGFGIKKKEKEPEDDAEEAAPKTEIISSDGKQEKQIEKEESLLEEVLKMKDLLEKMEEHALNNNKEAYDQEAKRLRELIHKVRE